MFMMKELPFALNALEPLISAQTMDFHYNKHYKTYCDKLNELTAGTRFETMSLEYVIKESFNNLPQEAPIYNNAAQVWNHEFFWHSLALSREQKEIFASKISQQFGTLEEFNRQFKQSALSQFGSGWCWAIRQNNHIKIIKTSNADNPLTLDGATPLFCIDVWEHAYYLDYQNRRGDFIDAFLKNLL